jgi:hypothetical protein
MCEESMLIAISVVSYSWSAVLFCRLKGKFGPAKPWKTDKVGTLRSVVIKDLSAFVEERGTRKKVRGRSCGGLRAAGSETPVNR